MQHISLDGAGWTLTPGVDVGSVPFHMRPLLLAGVAATVPGCVHTDLMAAGLMDDPYLGDNEVKQFWIGKTDWVYRRKFEVGAEMMEWERVELACDGLDTVATVEVNGEVVGTSATMHARQRFGVKKWLRVGENEVVVRFAAPRTYAEKQHELYGPMPVVGGTPGVQHPHHMIRKMACNFGWDWGPDVTTSGIYRGIRLEGWSGARVKAVRPQVVEAGEKRAVVRVMVDLEGSGDVEVGMRGPAGEEIRGKKIAGGVEFVVEKPALWWPVGYGGKGKRPLYAVGVEVKGKGGKVLDRAERRIGLRTSELVTTADSEAGPEAVGAARGERMELRVNGKAVYCKGANWIPDDCFPHRVTRERYEKRIHQAMDANMNMLRVWGGGLFESEDFYEICDELGVMVWQDFPFACSTYPEGEAYAKLVEEEARDNVGRLAGHPSLVVYNGGNENIVATYDWAAEFRKIREEGKKPWGLGYWFGILPKVIAELDPTRPYWPNSPYSGQMDRHPNANEYGNRHMWDVWHGDGQYRNYLGHFPRMATEFGYHAPPNYSTLARAIPAEQRYWNSPLLLLHNKNYQDGQKQTNTRMADDFTPPPPTTAAFDAWHYLAQTMQARALSMGIEWFRALYPWNTASLYWQFNDCWPVSSWSAIDGDGREKPLLHATRRFFAPRLLTIKPKRVTAGNAAITELSVYLHNDSDEVWIAPVTVREVTVLGDTLSSTAQSVMVQPRSLVKFDVPANMMTRGSSFLVASTPGAERAFWWFSADKAMAYPEPRWDAEVVRVGEAEYRVTLVAHTLLRDVSIQADRIHPEATVNDGHVTMLAGDRQEFVVKSPVEVRASDLMGRPVVWCANWFGGK